MRRRGWRIAAAIGGLLVLASCVVLLAALVHLGKPEAAVSAATILGVVLGIPALAVPLVRWLRRESAPTAEQVSQAEDTLVGLVAQQWRREALGRALWDPEPMPVCWRLTERAMMDHPRLVMAGELSFAGRSDHIGPLATQFRRVRRRRLVILGPAGSGKTTLAVQLLLELLATRQAGEPIPVLVSLARWDPVEQPRLQSWLADRLVENYPSLHAFGPDIPRRLAEHGKILPILDGLDELPAPRQATVITALNASLSETDQLVLTSRTAEYRSAVARAHDVLTAAAVIEPEPLRPTQAADYLAACLPPHPGPAWEQVLDRLRQGEAGALATVLATPLGLWLLRTVYLTPGADPTALLDSTADPAAVQAHFFDRLIPAVLSTRPPSRDPTDLFRPRRLWHPDQVRKWLTYLAEHLHRTGTRDFLWWHLARHTLTARQVQLGSGLSAGLTVGLTLGLVLGLPGAQNTGLLGLVVGLAVGLGIGLVFGLVAGLVVKGWLTNEPAHANLQLKHRSKLLARKLTRGLLLGLIVGVMMGMALALAAFLGAGLAALLGAELPEGIKATLRQGPLITLVRALANVLLPGLVIGLIGLVFGLVFGFVDWVGTPSKTEWATTPRSTYQATRTLAVLQTSALGLVFGLVLNPLAAQLDGDWRGGLLLGLVGVLVGLRVFGRGSLSGGAWFSYVLAASRLAVSRKLPLRLMDFLDDAYRLGLLRTTGPAYQFRHAEFHDRLLQTGGCPNRGRVGQTGQ